MLELIAIENQPTFMQVVGLIIICFVVWLLIKISWKLAIYFHYKLRIEEAKTFKDHKELFLVWSSSDKKKKYLFKEMTGRAKITSEYLFLASKAKRHGIMTNEEEWIKKAWDAIGSFEDAIEVIGYKKFNENLEITLEDEERAFELFKKGRALKGLNEENIWRSFTLASWKELLK